MAGSMTSSMVSILFASVLALGQVSAVWPTAPTAAEIEQAIGELGHDRFGVRERASAFLWRAGRAAEPALVEAAAGKDAEVVARAQRILRRFRYGIYPDTPEEVVREIARFRLGNPAVKQAVLRKLIDLQQMPTVLKLLKTPSDETSRVQLVSGLVKNVDKIAGGLFLAGDRAKVEDLMELGTVHEEGIRNYAAYLLVRGQLDAKIGDLQNRRPDSKKTDGRLLPYLLRAKGDLPGALRAAGPAPDPVLKAGLLFESGQWKELAGLHEKSAGDAGGPFIGGVVYLGYAAAYHRLAGNGDELEETVVAIKKLAERKPNKLWYCGEALMINERFQDAVELLREQRPAEVFDLLCWQLRFREAFELVGVRDPGNLELPWMTEPETETRANGQQRAARFATGLHVASALHRLGEKDSAERLFADLAAAAEADKNLSLTAVCEAEYRAGATKEAMDHVARVLSESPDTSVLQALYPEQAGVAEVWWKFLRYRFPDEAIETRLARLQRLLDSTAFEEEGDDAGWQLVEEAAAVYQKLAPAGPNRAKWLTVLGQTCAAGGKPRLARAYFETVVTLSGSTPAMLRLADLLSREKEWDLAAQWYDRAWQKGRSKPLGLYLRGRALRSAGRDAEGRRLIEAARLMPLGNAQTRQEFAAALDDRGLTEEAARQWEVTVRTGEFQSSPVNLAAQRLGDLLVGKDDLRAASYWQWALLKCLRTSTSNLRIEGYLRRLYLIHKVRARGLIAAGRVDEALREIRSARAVLPGEVTLATELVPLLDKAGQARAAEELFVGMFEATGAVCRDFPESALHHDNLARLAVRCNRRPDEALSHARRAVELVPADPAYVGTLAEVHFRQGNREQAVELARRCVKLAPREPRFRQQLAEYESP